MDREKIHIISLFLMKKMNSQNKITNKMAKQIAIKINIKKMAR